MLYIISIAKYSDKEHTRYLALDTISDSVSALQLDELKNILLNSNIQVINARLQKDKLIIKTWSNNITTFDNTKMTSACNGAKYILLASKEDGMYKIVDHHGEVSTICGTSLADIAKYKGIANCSTKMKTEDTYKIIKDEEFEVSIKLKYEAFIAKTRILSIGDISFKYDIENQEVRLVQYTGSSTDVVLPSFITSIKQNAFYKSNIKTIKLNEGLKVIGTRAFVTKEADGLLERIEIPESVELICNKAFVNNSKIVKTNGRLHADRFKLRSSKTIVLGQSIYS